MSGLRIAVIMLIAAVLSGCAAKSTFVLLPDEDGSVGEVTLTNAGGTQVMNGAYWAIDVASPTRAPSAPGEVDAAFVETRFADTLRETPREPLSLTLYFGSTAEDLTAESEAEIDIIVAAFREFPAPEIRVVGHTDTMGTAESNDALSLQRAETIKAKLVSEGVPADIIEVASHGETDPVVETPDETREPLNRRVEVTIR